MIDWDREHHFREMDAPTPTLPKGLGDGKPIPQGSLETSKPLGVGEYIDKSGVRCKPLWMD